MVENFDITTPATTSFTDTPVSPGTLINIILRATNRRNRPIANQTLSVDITALQMPLYYGGRIDIKKVIQVKAGNVTNANGEIFVT